MENELRAAAEEAIEMLQDVIDVYEGLEDEYRTDQAKEGYLRAMRERSIHRHYLSASRPDDMEPVTEEWLLSIGFEERGACALQFTLKHSLPVDNPDDHEFLLVCEDRTGIPCPWGIYNAWTDATPEERACLPHELKSRGQVRRLLSALAGE